MLDSKIKIIDIVNSVKNMDDNFIPADTKITVKQDGTGDFTNLTDALSYINGKYSNGIVYIEIYEGTYITSEPYSIYTTKFNFAKLVITGKSKNNTILYKNSWSTRWERMIYVFDIGTSVEFSNLTIKGTRQDNVLDSFAITSERGATVFCNDIKIIDFTGALLTYSSGHMIINNLEFSNLLQGMIAQGGVIESHTAVTITSNNVNTVCNVAEAGLMRLSRVTLNNTNVTTEFGQTINKVTSAGLILRG